MHIPNAHAAIDLANMVDDHPVSLDPPMVKLLNTADQTCL
jgi:hypothetical protein